MNFSRLAALVASMYKRPITKTGRLLAVVLLGVVLLGATAYGVRHHANVVAAQLNAQKAALATQSSAKVPQTSSLRDAQKAGQAASDAAPAATASTKISSATQPAATPSAKATGSTSPTATTPKKSASAATPTSGYTPPVATPLSITTIAASLGHQVCDRGQTFYTFSYTTNFNSLNTGGKLGMSWDLVALDGRTMTVGSPNGISATITPNTVRYSDDSADYAYTWGLQISLSYSYKARLHSYSPNDVVSNWITVPAGKESC